MPCALACRPPQLVMVDLQSTINTITTQLNEALAEGPGPGDMTQMDLDASLANQVSGVPGRVGTPAERGWGCLRSGGGGGLAKQVSGEDRIGEVKREG